MTEPAEVISGTGPGVYPRVTQYEVSVFPYWMRDSDDLLTAEEAATWALTVEYRGSGKWAVTRRGRLCLGAGGEWDWESIPSERRDEWLATHRFLLQTALQLAAEHAPKVTINGYTALDVLAKHEQRHANRSTGG